MQLTYSRDGRHWLRAGDRQVFLPLSQRPGDFDWGSIYPLQGPLLVGRRDLDLLQPASGSTTTTRARPDVARVTNGIGLAKLRMDGFVSLQAGSAGGSLTTKPLHLRRGTPYHQRRRPRKDGSRLRSSATTAIP